MRIKDCAFALQLVAQLHEVEDFAVINNDGIAVFAENRLIAAGDVQDCQAGSAQRDLFALEFRLLIGAAMGDGIHRIGENTAWQRFTKV